MLIGINVKQSIFKYFYLWSRSADDWLGISWTFVFKHIYLVFKILRWRYVDIIKIYYKNIVKNIIVYYSRNTAETPLDTRKH